VGTLRLAKREKIGSKLCSRSDEKIRKRSAGENKELYVKIDHLLNQNSRTANGEFRREKRTIKSI